MAHCKYYFEILFLCNICVYKKNSINNNNFFFHLFTLTICNCFYQSSMKKSPIFRSIIANSTARNLSKDNLLYHKLSESKYLWPYLIKSENLKFFPFYICQNQLPKNVERSFFTFFKRVSFHCQTFIDLKSL